MRNTIRNSIVILLVASTTPAFAEIAITPPSRTEPVDFNADILPFLKTNCLACHSESEAEGDLVLESAAAIRKGGSSGDTVVAGNSGESYLLQLAAHMDEPVMPPEDNEVGAKNLTPEQLGLLKLWIDQGAKDGTASVTSSVAFRALPKNIAPILAAVISADGRLTVCSRGNRIYVYDVASGQLVQELVDTELSINDQPTGTAHLDLVQSLAIDANGQWIASGGFRNIKLWQRKGRGEEKRIALPDTPTSLAVSPNGQVVAVSLANGAIQLIDVATNQVLRTLTGHQGKVNAVSYVSADRLASAGADKTIRVWNTNDGHSSSETVEHAALSLSCTANRVVTGHDDNMIRVWKVDDASRLTAERDIPGHTGPVTSLSSIPKRPNEIASGSVDGTARTWNLDTGQQIRSYNQESPVASIAVHHDGSRVLSTGDNQLARLWNNGDGNKMSEFKGNFRLADQVAAMDRRVALLKSEFEATKTRITDLEKQQKTRGEEAKKAKEAVPVAEKELADKTKAVGDAKVAKKAAEQNQANIGAALPEIDKLVAQTNAKRDATKKLADELNAGLETTRTAAGTPADPVKAKLDEVQKLVQTLRDQQNGSFEQLVARTGELKAAIAAEIEASKKKVEEATKKVTDSENAVKAAQRKLDQAKLNDRQRQKDHERSTAELASANAEKTAQESLVKSTEESRKSIADQEAKSVSRHVASRFSPSQNRLAVAAEQGGIYLYDALTGAANDRLTGHGAKPVAVDWANDKLVSIGEDKQLIIWSTRLQWTLARTLGGVETPGPLSDRVLSLDFSSDGNMLVAGSGQPSRSGEVSIWNVADGTLLRTIDDAHSDTVYAVEFSPDDKQIASSAADRMAKVFDVSDGKFVRGFEGHTHHVLDVAWQANGKSIATAGADNVIKIWNAATGEQRRTISGINKEVTSIAFAGISANTISSSGDTNIRIHKTGDGGVVRSMNGGGDFVYATAVSDDGKRIVSGGVKSILHVWNADDGKLLKSLMPTE